LTSGLFGARDIHFYIHVPLTDGASTPDFFYMFPERVGPNPPPPPPTN
jgi:hypothetical protein